MSTPQPNRKKPNNPNGIGSFIREMLSESNKNHKDAKISKASSNRFITVAIVLVLLGCYVGIVIHTNFNPPEYMFTGLCYMACAFSGVSLGAKFADKKAGAADSGADADNKK